MQDTAEGMSALNIAEEYIRGKESNIEKGIGIRNIKNNTGIKQRAGIGTDISIGAGGGTETRGAGAGGAGIAGYINWLEILKLIAKNKGIPCSIFQSLSQENSNTQSTNRLRGKDKK